MSNKKECQAGCEGLLELLQNGEKETLVGIFEFVPSIFENAVAAKEKPTVVAAEALVRAIYEKVEEFGISFALKALEKSLDGKAKPPAKELALEIVEVGGFVFTGDGIGS